MLVKLNKVKNIAEQINYGGYVWDKRDGVFECDLSLDEVKTLEGMYGKDAFAYDKPKTTRRRATKKEVK